MKSKSVDFILSGRRLRRRRWILVTSLLAMLACLLCCAMLILGSNVYPVQDVIRALTGEQIKGVSFAVNTIRLPRMLAGLFAGFAFGIAGYKFQTMLRNPLANPNVIGITSGSSAAAVFCIIVLHTSEAVISVASVIAGLATVVLIYVLSRGRTFSVGRLILVGIGIQAMLDALISYLLLVGKQQDIPATLRWLAGSLNGSQMSELPPLVITVFIFAPILVGLGKPPCSVDGTKRIMRPWPKRCALWISRSWPTLISTSFQADKDSASGLRWPWRSKPIFYFSMNRRRF
jgi:iron complex transport system permease protein